VKQQYLPDGLTDKVFYEPSDQGHEKEIREHFARIKGKERE
jgi:putative ATPase